MDVEIRNSFAKAAKKLPLSVKLKVAEVIQQLDTASSIREIVNCKKMTAYRTAYRIKIGDYRIGLFCEKEVVELTTVMHRKDVYKYFP